MFFLKKIPALPSAGSRTLGKGLTQDLTGTAETHSRTHAHSCPLAPSPRPLQPPLPSLPHRPCQHRPPPCPSSSRRPRHCPARHPARNAALARRPARARPPTPAAPAGGPPPGLVSPAADLLHPLAAPQPGEETALGRAPPGAQRPRDHLRHGVRPLQPR